MKISMKPLAMLSGRDDVTLSKPFLGLSDRVLGQIRTGVAFLGGILIKTGLIYATADDLTESVDLLFEIIKQLEVILGSGAILIAGVSSWFSRDKR